MTPLTVVCLLVAGPVAEYSVEHVVRLERMVRAHLARPFRFVCFTDGSRGALPALIETVEIPAVDDAVPLNGRGYWHKLQIFNPTRGLAGRVLYLDLDVLVVGDMAPIVDWPAPLALADDELRTERPPLERDRHNRQVKRRFNGSVIVWDAGTQDALFTGWAITATERLSTDQDWIGEQAPHAQAMPASWFPRISRVQPPWPADAKVVFVKKPKPMEAARRWPWFDAAWGAARA